MEIEAFAATNLVAKMEEGKLDPAPIFTNVKTFPYGKFRGCVDILSGGFPCQPFSAAGQRKGTEDPRHLFPYIRDGIRECQPRIVFLENVEGIISSKTADGESVLKYVLRELEGLGYIATAGVFSASEVGAPHQRKRVFILGYSKHNGPYGSEESRGVTATVRDKSKGTDTTGQPSGASASKELADSNSWRGEVQNQGELTGEQVLECNGSQRRAWPSRPGEPQHEWEEPRVVESKLGGATNGASSRVDRLRLLGNGVVPQTAAKAFVTLINRVI